jgi:hypoxanthine-guanine phosphoribosyltransferase
MPNDDFIKIILVSILGLNCLFVGYVLGKINTNSRGSNVTPGSFFSKQKDSEEQKVPMSKKIKIDDKKFVGDIITDKLEKKYDVLGDTKTSSENISGSINKLKNMKG